MLQLFGLSLDGNCTQELSEIQLCVWGIASTSDINLTLFERDLKLKCEIQLCVWGIASSS